MHIDSLGVTFEKGQHSNGSYTIWPFVTRNIRRVSSVFHAKILEAIMAHFHECFISSDWPEENSSYVPSPNTRPWLILCCSLNAHFLTWRALLSTPSIYGRSAFGSFMASHGDDGIAYHAEAKQQSSSDRIFVSEIDCVLSISNGAYCSV